MRTEEDRDGVRTFDGAPLWTSADGQDVQAVLKSIIYSEFYEISAAVFFFHEKLSYLRMNTAYFHNVLVVFHLEPMCSYSGKL